MAIGSFAKAHPSSVEGWAVVGAWAVVLVPLAAAIYRRDTGRV